MNRNISILGSGWLGYPLALHFVQKKYDVKTSTTIAEKLEQLRAIGTTPFIVDINELTSDTDAFLASETLVINIPSNNVEAYRALLKKIKRSPVENIILVSSTSVYPAENQLATEDDALPASTRRSIEKVFTNNKRLNTTVLRFAGMIGYRRHPGLFFTGDKLLSSPDAPVNLIHRDDCIEIINQVVRQQCWNETFNCCADSHPSKLVFYTHAAAMLHQPPPQITDTPGNAGKTISNEHLKATLKYSFIHPNLMKIDF